MAKEPRLQELVAKESASHLLQSSEISAKAVGLRDMQQIK
jgi:hypothetical protein